MKILMVSIALDVCISDSSALCEKDPKSEVNKALEGAYRPEDSDLREMEFFQYAIRLWASHCEDSPRN